MSDPGGGGWGDVAEAVGLGGWGGPDALRILPDFVGGGLTGAARIVDERDHVPAPAAKGGGGGGGVGGAGGGGGGGGGGGTDGLRWQRAIAAGLRTVSWHHVDVQFPGVVPMVRRCRLTLSHPR